MVAGAVVAWEIANAFMEKFSGDSMEEIRVAYNNWLKMIKDFTGGSNG